MMYVVVMVGMVLGALFFSGLLPALTGTLTPARLARRTAVAGVVGKVFAILFVLYLVVVWIPRPGDSEEKRRIASMKSDLRTLGTAQETHFADATRYFSGTASNVGGAPIGVQGYIPSPGVTVSITAVPGDGSVPASFNATATHVGTDAACVVYHGEFPATPATIEGEPACTPRTQKLTDRVWCALRFGNC